MSVCMQACIHTLKCIGTLDFLKLVLQAVVSLLAVWMLGTELGSYGREINICNCRDISPSPQI